MFDRFKRWLTRGREPRVLPAELAAILRKNVPLAARLSEIEQRELERLVLTFLDEKTFEGAGGFEITDEVKVTIAAQACVLLLNRDTDVYPGLDTVIVYPSTYVARAVRREGMVVIEGESARLGESWDRGVVVLAWDAVRRGTLNVRDGHNVVLHEFAHQLDSEDGAMDGAPRLVPASRYGAWAAVLGAEYEELVEKVHAGRRSSIDDYGATSPPEFFAVVTEMFFEKPVQLRDRHPELYDVLADFYRQDPASAASGETTESRRERRERARAEARAEKKLDG